MDLIDILVWLGTLTFAITGALVAVRKRFDLVGVVFLGAVTAIGGGSIRDLMAGVIPPTPLTDPARLWGIVIAFLLVPVSSNLGITAGIAVALVLRVVSRLADLSLPVPRQPHNPDTANALD